MKTILVIEDNLDNMELVQEILEDAGYKVFGTESAENGIEILRRGIPIHLILMDISLPQLDGYQATRLIKKDSKLNQIPIVMLTAYASKDDRTKGFESGCDDFFTKPIVDEEEFLRLIEKHINRSDNAD